MVQLPKGKIGKIGNVKNEHQVLFPGRVGHDPPTAHTSS
jgi:hypothetical protein